MGLELRARGGGGLGSAPNSALGIAAPLETTGQASAVWLPFDPPRPVSDVDHYPLGSLCAQLGVALSRARSFDEQRTVAVALQSSILGPTNPPEEFAVRYEPALESLEVGGDWYDAALPLYRRGRGAPAS